MRKYATATSGLPPFLLESIIAIAAELFDHWDARPAVALVVKL